AASGTYPRTLGGIRMGWTVLAVAFAGVWVYTIYREDIRNPEPVWMVLLATLAGAGAMPAAFWAERWLLPDGPALDGTYAARAAAAFLVGGPVEEGLKFLAVFLLVWRWTQFDEPLDGLVY